MQFKLRVVFLVMMLIPQGVLFGLAKDTVLATDKWFNQIQAIVLVSALLLALLMPGVILAWLIGNNLGKIRRFCLAVKQGDYSIRLALPNEARDKHDEDVLTLLMRDMNWMARQIGLREQELLTVQERLNERTTELEAACKQMQVMALTDPLTTIANRRCFFDTMEKQFASLVCTCRPISLVMLDVDRFKTINDSFGHEAGDKVLLEIAGIITRYSRENDLAARIGGEEFTVLLPGAGSREAMLVARRIQTAIAAHTFALGGKPPFSITVSIGICTLAQTPCFERDNLYNYADQALYYSKNNGRNAISVFDPVVHSIVKVS